jgi:hypothetical protein
MDLSFVDPSTLTPLFTAQQVICAYPISDIWVSTPRYLYYALLVLVLVLRTRVWLANVFLGAAATYAGSAAIEAFVLLASKPKISAARVVSIPFVSSAALEGNDTLNALQNLVVDTNTLKIAPAVMELDIDGILAVVVTGYLTMLPMHCWSQTVRAYRSLHILIGIWNIIILAGSICALILWPTISWDNFPYQYRFCYPDYTDGTDTANDDPGENSLSTNWNQTIWDTFTNVTTGLSRSSNCFYPCFAAASSALRLPKSATASLNTNRNPRTSNTLTNADYDRFDQLTYFMYVAIALSTILALVLLMLNITGLRRLTRIPVHRPQQLWPARKELWHALSTDVHSALSITRSTITSPRRSISDPATLTRLKRRLTALARFLTDLTALISLLLATIFVPITTIVFIVWIEWYIHRDFISDDAPKLVSQWSPVVAIALVLCSALVIRLRYRLAPREEIEGDVAACRERLGRLEALLREREVDEDRVGQRGRFYELVGLRKGGGGIGATGSGR